MGIPNTLNINLTIGIIPNYTSVKHSRLTHASDYESLSTIAPAVCTEEKYKSKSLSARRFFSRLRRAFSAAAQALGVREVVSVCRRRMTILRFLGASDAAHSKELVAWLCMINFGGLVYRFVKS